MQINVNTELVNVNNLKLKKVIRTTLWFYAEAGKRIFQKIKIPMDLLCALEADGPSG
jgi:hypothetical protein